MKKSLIFVAIILIILLLFILSIPLVNNLCAIKVKNELENLPLPDNTEFIESVWQAGKLNGNGNGMQYLGLLLLKSELSYDEINEFYKSYRKNAWQYKIKAQETQKADIIEHGELVFSHKLDSSQKYYIVYSWGEGIKPFCWLDLRGN